MKKSIIASLLFAGYTSGVLAAPAFDTKAHPNLFVDMNIASQMETTTKVEQAYQQLFFGDQSTERVYFEHGQDMGFIKAVDSDDIRSEGMSYGMTIAVMMDDQATCNKLWNFSKTYMQHQTGDRKFYFSWQLNAKAPFNMIDPNSAPDGEEYFAMALMFAANRWGNGSGIYDYSAEANLILDEMINKPANSTTVPMINPVANQIIFTPDARSEAYTDPSYHIPAFYELFSKWATDNNDYWLTVAETSREFFPKAAHPVTGLYSEYSEFDGTPKVTSFNPNSHLSAFDSMRTIQNVAFDYAWFEDDESAVELANRILSFYSSQPGYVSVYTHDGVPQVDYRMEAHVAMNAVAALAADIPEAKTFVQDLWELPVPTGKWRYYNGLLYMLGLLHTSGEFKIYHPTTDAEPKPPTAEPLTFEVSNTKQLNITLNGFDVDGQVTDYTITQLPAHGLLSGEGALLTYKPEAGFIGMDTIQYTVTDNDGLTSKPASISIKVTGQNKPVEKLTCEVSEFLWNSGYTARVTVTNETDKPIYQWQVDLALAPGDKIDHYWSSNIAGKSGTVVVKNASWNGSLQPGDSADFGFNATHLGIDGRPKVSCE